MQSFKIIKPALALAPYVRYYWILRDSAEIPVTERTLPIGCVQLVFHRGKRLLSLGERELQPQSFICGQSMDFTDVISTGEIDMITVVLQPHAAKAILHLPLNLFYGGLIPMDDMEDRELAGLSNSVACAPDQEACVHLIEDFLIHRLYTFNGYHLKQIGAALHLINTRIQVSTPELSDMACLGPKQFNRVFLDYVGATPKDFARIVRMQRALFKIQRDPSLSFAQLAYEAGFSDQSHMIKEFKLFSGYTPQEYLGVCAPYSDYFSD